MRPLILAAAAGLGLIASSALAETPIVPDATLLEVSAIGRTVRTPDIATIRAGVVTQAPTAAAAAAENAGRMTRVIAALKGAGIAARDLSTSALALSPQYRYAENQPPAITGYQATNTVSVRFRDVAKAGKVLDALVAQGANQIDGPALSLDDPDAALDEARTDAVKRARARAELYARAAGLRVERIVSISEAGEDRGGSPPPVLYMARAKAAADSTEVLPGETDVAVAVAVRFLLK